MMVDPNAQARATVRVALNAAGFDATEELLDVVVDAVLATSDRDLAITDVVTYAGLNRGTATKLVDLAREALEDGGHL